MKFQILKVQGLFAILENRSFQKNIARGDSKIMLIENDKMLLKNEEVAKRFNQYFGHITDII